MVKKEEKGLSKLIVKFKLERFKVLMEKGKLNKDEKERQSTKKFKALRKQHSAVESDINCLEHHGLNRCPDKGIKSFRKYTALGVLAYSLHKLGNILLEQDRQAISAKAA